jgi:glyoxylase-like metal-dependent hydrolase (beta-lactamase superfamily II)
VARVPSRLRKKIEWLLRRAEGVLLPDAVLAGVGAHLDPAGARLALRVASDDVEVVGASERVALLLRAGSDASAREKYIAEYGVCGTRRFDARGASIFQLSVETFDRHINNVYVVVENGSSLLFDCGSGVPSSERDLALGFAVLEHVFGASTRREDVETCLVSHAHADHWGGVNRLRATSRAVLAVHELDARVVESFEERLAATAKEIDEYWKRSGVSADARVKLRADYEYGKALFRSEKVDRKVRDGDVVGAGYKVHHVPGHCPGLVCLQVHDVLLTSDHVLARITPHQFPPSISASAGLVHYFDSLAKVSRLEGIRLALGGHEEPIWDLRGRIREIETFHHDRLERTREICETPKTVLDITRELFGEREGYDMILAIDEAGAHVEHLHALGRVRAIDDGVIRYEARSSAA